MLWHEYLNTSKPGYRESFERLRSHVLSAYSEEDVNTIAERFCPLGCWPQFVISEIFILLAYVVDKAFQLEALPEYSSEKNADGKIKVPWKSSSETDTHHDLKQQATHWLRECHGAKKVFYEIGYQAGIADVASRDQKWFVECGASRPSKVWQFFSLGDPGRAIVFFNGNGITIFKEGAEFGRFKASVEEFSKRFVSELDEAFKSPS